ncbi:beta-ketoacyl synthase [Streptomyces sp. NBC_00572]|uniref:beta-ketoacyl-[acyl-carrier-protein] synthase family protein n=1 Tax=Streptomyces sp. NBC_00572 TaxID=2903664 RepID=UPI002254C443|nr:beta-ketoacyl synthase N-terminal-like domain-containing protein [Streptomyces sp. NBC_00572]MCX4984953.1 beta-ketoacyl-[acyl-carrier-protein] synthase family protein [Streptomyces sp. NBC_00572]
MEPVLITGTGAVTCHGPGTRALWDAMTTGAARPPDKLPDPYARMDLPLMYLVPEDGPADRAGHRSADGAGRATSFALAAAREALAEAGIEPGHLPASRTAVVLGTCMGSTGEQERDRVEERRSWASSDGEEWRPGFDVASGLAAALGVGGVVTSVSNACAASGFALGIAADLIRCGEADVVISGGADAYSRIALASFNRMGAVDPRGCRPFAVDRAGTVFGEGAAVVVLESAAHAAARGARPSAELADCGWSCDAHHPTAPEPGGEQITRTMRLTLRASGLGPDDIGCVIPHGTGTRLNDQVESAALNSVFAGADGGVPPLYSLKALIGHTGGAAAGLAAVAATLVVRHGSVPGNVPVGRQDPECAVPVFPAPVPLGNPAVLVNAYAFGGNNASFVVREAVPC